MSLNATTLSGAISSTDTLVRLASGTGAEVGKLVKVDNEFMQIQNVDLSPFIKVARGQRGTLAVDHASGAVVNLGPANDFAPPPNSPALQPSKRQYTYGAAGAIEKADGTHLLNTGAASAMTLAAPTGDQNGMRLRIVAQTAHAYTVTYSTGFNGGGAGVDVATLGGAVGDNMEIEAINGTWLVLSTRNVTLA
jgi:hypothetical protein